MSAILMDRGGEICIVSKGHLPTKIVPMTGKESDMTVVEVADILVLTGISSMHQHKIFVSNHLHFKEEDHHLTLVRLADSNSGVGVHRWVEAAAVAILVEEEVLRLNGEKDEKDQEILIPAAGVDVGDN